MELKTAIEILDYHQEWRLGKRDDMIHEPKKLTEALDIVLAQVKKLTLGKQKPLSKNKEFIKSCCKGNTVQWTRQRIKCILCGYMRVGQL